jgi:hypothetical protein
VGFPPFQNSTTVSVAPNQLHVGQTVADLYAACLGVAVGETHVRQGQFGPLGIVEHNRNVGSRQFHGLRRFLFAFDPRLAHSFNSILGPRRCSNLGLGELGRRPNRGIWRGKLSVLSGRRSR